MTIQSFHDCRQHLLVCLTLIALWVMIPNLGQGAEGDPSSTGQTSTSLPSIGMPAAPSLAPSFRRVELATGAMTTIKVDLVLAAPATLLSVEADCGCIRAEPTTSQQLIQGSNPLRIQVMGILPGMKTLTVRTTAGTATTVIQVVTPGLGDGAAVAAELRTQSTATGNRLVVIVHDLKGETRNCGCSGGSLGGIDHLATLRDVLPGARLLLTGTIENSAISVVGHALAPYGWEIAPADIVTTSDPLAALDRPGLLAVIITGNQAVANQRVVKPVLDRGAVAIVLLVTPQGTIVSQHLLPIDRTLPSVAALAKLAGDSPPVAVDRTANPSTACSACHQASHATWSASAHARAFASLPPADQGNSCATCHSTPLPGTAARAPDVGCTSCHLGADAHASTPTTRTTGTTDCRTCHDAQHQPGFDPVAAWLRMQHGK